MAPERQYNLNGRAAAVAVRERPSMPGTPSRKEKLMESSALQDPGLKDYVRTTHDVAGMFLLEDGLCA